MMTTTPDDIIHSPEFIEGTKQGIEDWRAGRVHPLSEVLAEMSTSDLAARRLRALAKDWPEDFWLFAADGGLYLMQKKDGKRVFDPDVGGVSRDYIIQKFEIPADGGDW